MTKNTELSHHFTTMCAQNPLNRLDLKRRITFFLTMKDACIYTQYTWVAFLVVRDSHFATDCHFDWFLWLRQWLVCYPGQHLTKPSRLWLYFSSSSITVDRYCVSRLFANLFRLGHPYASCSLAWSHLTSAAFPSVHHLPLSSSDWCLLSTDHDCISVCVGDHADVDHWRHAPGWCPAAWW